MEHFAEASSTRTPALTARQKSEMDYHADYAARHKHLITEPVALRVCTARQRRGWNAYWYLYDLIRALPLRGQRVLVPGCGFGEDCVRIASLGAEVHGIDLSPDVSEIAKERVDNVGPDRVAFAAMPSEDLRYPDNYFDAVVLVNILHHVDVERSMSEVRRVARPGANILGLEMYTHSTAQRVRNSSFLSNVVYPRVRRAIYGSAQPYITPDERKLDETEIAAITADLNGGRLAYFSIFAERLFSAELDQLCRIDRMLARMLGPIGKFVAGRVVFSGTLTK